MLTKLESENQLILSTAISKTKNEPKLNFEQVDELNIDEGMKLTKNESQSKTLRFGNYSEKKS
jgi:hypothetical protein